jgi:hypothetical protein
MTAVLAVVLACSLFLTYGTLAMSAEDAARDRLAQAVHQIAGSIAGGTLLRAELLRDAAATPEIRAALRRTTDTAAARPVLARLVSARDSLPVELWNAEAERVGYIGATTRAAWHAPSSRLELARRALIATGDSAHR